MKKRLKKAALVVLLLFIGLQAVPVDRSNPPVNSAHAVPAPPEVTAILRDACYDCHSNETRWPWYTDVAPVSWWIAGHIHEGRRTLNFSEWSSLDAQRQVKVLNRMEDEIMEGRMPPPSYLLLHPDARISPAQNKILTDWSNTTILQLNATSTP